MTAAPQFRDIIVFDALCVLCSANAQIVLRNDTKSRFALAAMQGDVGARIYADEGIDPTNPETLVVVTTDAVFRNSDAVIHIYRHLGWPWRILGVFALVPRAVRDPLYRMIARNRYRLFGQRNSCWVPDSADRQRLL
jgi:predicted DCC family thiol-disulfide oxidoreductase YuxK